MGVISLDSSSTSLSGCRIVNKPKEKRGSPPSMSRLHLKFLTSAVNLQGCPEGTLPEIALVGRSNAGKSSLINGMSNSRVAMVSSTPGKTRLLNFYQTEKYRLVDMPGYGFASRSGGEQRSWQKMIEPYLASRGNLVGLIIVMDIRRDWSEDEENLASWIAPRGLPLMVALTKADKLSRSEIMKRVKALQKASGVDAVFATSALKKEGYAELEGYFFREWVKPILHTGGVVSIETGDGE